MKKIFSGILLTITLPVRLFKKTKIDNFVGGLIFGAIFSLVVNVVTVQVQEIIQKQHILEAVENEITNNTLKANYLSKQDVLDSKSYNPFYVVQRYSSSLWEQSSEPLQYIAQLDQETQIAVTGYYTTTVPLNNGMLDKAEKITDERLVGCVNFDKTLNSDKLEECKKWNDIKLSLEQSTGVEMAKQGFDVMSKFHPTKDRLNNWFLRLLMGSKSVRVLSGE
jgi:hypothetical protein